METSKEDYQKVIDACKVVFTLATDQDAIDLLTNLAEDYTDTTNSYFVDFVERLPVETISENVQKSISGSFGNVRTGKTYAYKVMRLNNVTNSKLNKEYRDILCEIVIQLILSCDASHGDKIPKIIKVIKETSRTRRVTIQMEKFEGTFLQALTQTKFKNLKELQPIFTDLCQALEHFQTTYKFNHKDMKPNNLMLKEGKIKFIDFGYSILQFHGKQYNAKREGAYSKLYFSKEQDLVQMSYSLANLMKFSGSAPRVFLLQTKMDSLTLEQFFLKVVSNLIPENPVQIEDYVLNHMTNTYKRYTKNVKSNALNTIYKFEKQKDSIYQHPSQITYNFEGKWLNGQFQFPFAQPERFLDLFNCVVEDKPWSSYSNNVLNGKKSVVKKCVDMTNNDYSNNNNNNNTLVGGTRRRKRSARRTQKHRR